MPRTGHRAKLLPSLLSRSAERAFCGEGMLFKKGSATSAGFRPSHWSYYAAIAAHPMPNHISGCRRQIRCSDVSPFLRLTNPD